jgi:cytochrome c553
MKFSMILLALLCSVSANTQAQDAVSGKIKYVSCTACHGNQGQGGVGPKLQGQPAEVIVQKLTAYKNKQKVGPQSELMWGMAGALSADDIKNIAAYTATLK